MACKPSEASKPKKKILFVFTGGTLGVRTVNGVDILDKDTIAAIVQSQAQGLSSGDYEVEVIEPLLHPKKSADLTSEDRFLIADAIKGRLATKEYSGVIVAHGTDTMTTTADYLALTVDASFPVVLTGSQNNLNDLKKFDGFDNLAQALTVVLNGVKKLSGVSIVFAGRIFAPFTTSKTSTVAEQAYSSTNPHGTVSSTANGSILQRLKSSGEQLRRLFDHNTRGNILSRIQDFVMAMQYFITLPNDFRLPTITGVEKPLLPDRYPGSTNGYVASMDGADIESTTQALVRMTSVKKGIVIIEAAGAGNLNSALVEPIKSAIKAGVVVVLTSPVLDVPRGEIQSTSKGEYGSLYPHGVLFVNAVPKNIVHMLCDLVMTQIMAGGGDNITAMRAIAEHARRLIRNMLSFTKSGAQDTKYIDPSLLDPKNRLPEHRREEPSTVQWSFTNGGHVHQTPANSKGTNDNSSDRAGAGGLSAGAIRLHHGGMGY